MCFYSTEVACLIGPSIAIIAHCALAGLCIMRIPFVLLAFFDPLPADFPVVPAFTAEHTIAFDRRKMYLFSMLGRFIPAPSEFLDLRHIIAQPFKIRAI